jgi:PAS domain S-box-containing protein
MNVAAIPEPGYRRTRLSPATGLFLIALSLAVLAGWIFGIEPLARIIPGRAAMKVNTALCFLASGACLWLVRDRRPGRATLVAGRLLAALVSAVGLLTLGEYVWGVDLGIDELLVRRRIEEAGNLFLFRMSPITATGFVLAGAGLALLDRPARGIFHPSDCCAAFVLLAGLLGLVGHLYSVDVLYRVGLFSSMAIHTGLGSVVLGLGLLSARPERGLASMLARGGPGAVLAKRLVPVAILLPIFLGWLRVAGERAGYYELAFGTAIFALSLAAFQVGVIWWTAASLERLDGERSRAEEARENLALLPLQNPAPVLRIADDGILLFANLAAQPLLSTWNTRLGEPVPDAVRRMIAKLGEMELSVGETAYHGTVSRPSGKSYVNLYCIDITARKRAEEQAVRAREDLHRALTFDEAVMSNMGEGLYTVDGQGLVTTMNPAAEKLFGWSFAELRGRRMHDATHYKHPDGTPFPGEQCSGLQALRQGMTLTGQEDVFIRKDGAFFDVVYSAAPIREGDRVTGLVVVFRDVSEQRQADRELRRAHDLLGNRAKHLESVVEQRTLKLQETIHDLEAFSYSVSHDLRAPLRAMKSFSMILQEEESAALGPKGRDYLRRIGDAAERMDRLVRDVLDYSRVVRAEFPLEPVDVDKLLRGILESYPGFQPPQAEIEIEGKLPRVLGNEAALTQCFSNLVGNAVKFVAPGISPRVRIWSERRDGRVIIHVKDNGIGIEKEFQDKIFGIFKRLRRDYEGTGIGLTIVKKAVERMGGSIAVDSAPREGSTFSLSLADGDGGKP